MRPSAAELAATLGLDPHPEGGFFRETYRSAETVATARGERPVSTAILFLVTSGSVSRLHRLVSDELWVFQGGDPLELVVLEPGGPARVRLLGDPATDARAGEALEPQALVAAGSWQGARVAGARALPADRAWSLVSCIVTPGFDYADFELGSRDELLAAFPDDRELILALT